MPHLVAGQPDKFSRSVVAGIEPAETSPMPLWLPEQNRYFDDHNDHLGNG